MFFSDKLNVPGDHPFLLQGVVGQVEAVLTIPDQVHAQYFAVLGHPHSLHGGTMNNKVVATMVRAFKELGIPSLRFNFRGVGQSAGAYDAGIGESEDMILLARQWLKDHPTSQLIFAGFSFGSYVAYRAAAHLSHALLISIAPAVHHYNYQEFDVDRDSWLIIQGDADEIVPHSAVLDFAKSSTPAIAVIEFANTGHFFHGKLVDLKGQLMNYVTTKAQLS